jgi:phosphate transport system permease protein
MTDAQQTLGSGFLQGQKYKRRKIKNQFSRWLIRVGGISVIIVIALMFLYFISITAPLFKSATLTKINDFSIQTDGQDINSTQSLLLSIDEQIQTGMQLSDDSTLVFFNLNIGEILKSYKLSDTNSRVTSFTRLPGQEDQIAIGFEDGSIQIVQEHYALSYENDLRSVIPTLHFPYETGVLSSAYQQQQIDLIAASDSEDKLLIASYSDNISSGNNLTLNEFVKAQSLWDDTATFETTQQSISTTVQQPSYILTDPAQHWLYLANQSGDIELFDISDTENPTLIDQRNLTTDPNSEEKYKLVDVTFLTGGISILATDSSGKITQWTPVRGENNEYQLKKIRVLDTNGSVVSQVLPEKMTKGFISIDTNQTINLFHTTSERHLLSKKLSSGAIANAAIAPRSNAILVEYDNKRMELWQLQNEHPEISIKVLWHRVWYENHEQPKFLWQSSSAANDFEPKFSLMPLTFGTIKAAFYAMLVATPLALMSAIYTAYFMSKSLQRVVKPAIEIMEAIPTVILGFLAGLWLAPFAEHYLMGILAIIILLPPAILAFSFSWDKLPHEFKRKIPEDWQPFLLIPLILFIVYSCIQFDAPVEQAVFGTEFRLWLSSQGIDFDQRNALIVGIAMGFAVIPTIYSITEDAVHCVPSSLINGSLALGATRWQTMQNIIIPTASPAIFSAVMIGFGRAIGETMIVLMATGNTPIMDINIFEGMRTLSANLAVELPESEVGSTHFRILFLSALILFAFTFLLNTIAETVRQSLRNRYSKV